VCLIDLRDFINGIAADEIEKHSEEIKKKFSNPTPAKSTPAFFVMLTVGRSSVPRGWKISSA